MTPLPPPRQDTAPPVRSDDARPGAGVASSPGWPTEAALPGVEALGHSLAHDLRAPLRAIEGYAQALVEDYGDRLPLEARDVVARIREASHTIEARIDALLRLA